MTKFRYVVVAKDSKFSLGTLEEIQSLNNESREVKCISNNTKSLPEIYNEYLNESRAANDVDFLVFMHADVKVDLASLEAHCIACESKYDVMGLCGTSIINVSQSPLNWWTGSNPTPNAKWGCVTHGEIGNQTSYFSKHTPDQLDHEVACIDGLCIIFTKKALGKPIYFDTQFQYDFYDTDLSFQCVLKYQLRLGVIVEKSLQHYSVGKSILTRDFLQHEVDFRKKWNLEIPPNSPINTKLKNS